MISLVIWLGILWACFAVGAAALRRLGARADSLAEEAPFAIALGMGALSYLMLAAGLLGWLKLWVGVALVAGLAVAGWRHALRLPREIGASLVGSRTSGWFAVPVALFLLAAFALTLIGALAPAGDNDYDGLVYHLTVPKLYLQEGRIHSLPWESHSNFPFALEMLYLLGLMLKGQTLAKLFHFGCGWLTVVAVFGFGRRWWGERAGWLGAVALAAIPLVGWEMMSAYNGLAFALYVFLTVYALSRWHQDREATGWLWVGAVMCGLAMGVQTLAAAVLVFALAVLLWRLVRAPGRGGAAARVVAFAAIACAVASPWYVKSYLWTGNPVYPFFYEVFGGTHWTAARAESYAAAQKAFGLGGGPLAFLALPWNLTMRPQAFFDQPGVLRHFSVLISVFGPLLLALAPALLVAGPAGKAGRLALWFALVYAAIWFGMSQNGRYLLPILPGLCACAGVAGARLLERRGIAAAAVMVAFLLSAAAGLGAALILAAPAARVAMGAEPQADYLGRVSQAYALAEAVNRATPAEARVLVLGDEPRLFYLDREYLLGNHTEIFTARELADAGSFLAALEAMKVTHVLMPAGALFAAEVKHGTMESALVGLVTQGKLRLVEDYGRLSLWEIADAKRVSDR